jgi:hypothetical protein
MGRAGFVASFCVTIKVRLRCELVVEERADAGCEVGSFDEDVGISSSAMVITVAAGWLARADEGRDTGALVETVWSLPARCGNKRGAPR